jgi:hypothetical protein
MGRAAPGRHALVWCPSRSMDERQAMSGSKALARPAGQATPLGCARRRCAESAWAAPPPPPPPPPHLAVAKCVSENRKRCVVRGPGPAAPASVLHQTTQGKGN